MNAALSLHEVGFRYGGGAHVLCDISLTVHGGELLGIVGPSGAGKTTLLKILLGQLAPTSGTVHLEGAARGVAQIGYVPQLDPAERTFPLTVCGAVLLGAASTSRRVPWFSRAERAAATSTLARLGIEDLADRRLDELSGGQFQRVLLARALAARPRVLLLDEPTSGIDLATRLEVLSLLEDLAAEGLAVVLTTHDLNWVAARLPRIVCLNHTIVADGAPSAVLTAHVLRATFGVDMLVLDHHGRRVVVDGDLPVVAP